MFFFKGLKFFIRLFQWLIVFYLLGTNNLLAQPSKTLEKNKIREFVYQNIQKSINPNDLNEEYVILQQDTIATIYFNADFFLVFKQNTTLNPIWAYSFEKGLERGESLEHLKQWVNLNKETQDNAPIKNKASETHGPLVNSLFGQVNCHNQDGNIINVSNLFTPDNIAVGCVAITLATALQYSQWPVTGSGFHEYTDNEGKYQGEHSVNYSNTTYFWDQIMSRYDYVESTVSEREALGELSYHAAVALDMDFENGGSTSNVNKIPLALSKYFKHYGEYKASGSAGFYKQIDTMILKNRVVPLAVSGNGFGHSVVCDGWKTDASGNKYYHLNMGWWGNTNGWYQIQNSFNAGGYSSIVGGVFNLVPTPSLKSLFANNEFKLEWQSPPEVPFANFELQVKIGRSNWQTLDASLENNSFTIPYDGKSIYSFRVRMHYTQFPELLAWSNVEIYDPATEVIDKKHQDEAIFYPNPVIESINIQKLDEDALITIFDNQGRIVIKYHSNQTECKIDVAHLNNGIYFLKIESNSQASQKKFIKI